MTTLPHSSVSGPVIRVLVVDDSVVARRVVARAIEADPLFELAGVAANGRAALEKLEVLQPDVLVLDLDMPVMDGFEMLAALRITHTDLPVIVFSHLTHAGASATMDALALGATGFALKPNANDIGLAQELVRAELLPLLAAVTRPQGVEQPVQTSRRFSPTGALPQFQVTAVVVAVSTGGPNALAEIVPSLPADLSVPVFIVQHMPPLFTAALAQRLNKIAALDVVEAGQWDRVEPGRIYIAPGGRHMALQRTGEGVQIELHDGAPENSCRPAANVLFRSAAQVYGPGVAAVVLTGMGSDGLRGCEAVHAAGGSIMVQDAASSVVASMPGAVADAGLAHSVLPLHEIGPALASWTGREAS